MDDVVIHRYIACLFVFLARYGCLSDSHAAGSEVVDVALSERAIPAALAKPNAVPAEVAELAVFNRHVPRAVGLDNGIDRRGRLARLKSAGRREGLAVAEL